MIIGDKSAAFVSKLYSQRIERTQAAPAKKPVVGMAGAEGDQVEISAEAMAIREASDAAEASEAGRAERVAQLRDAVARGEYEVPVDELATRLMANV